MPPAHRGRPPARGRRRNVIDARRTSSSPRPAPAADAGPLDERSTTSSRRASGGCSSTTRPSRRSSASTPRTIAWATRSRDAVLDEIAADRAHLAAVEALDPAGLSRDGAVRARPRDPQPPARASSTRTCSGVWERRSTAIDGVGDALFALFARDFAPLPERLERDHRPARGGAARSSQATKTRRGRAARSRLVAAASSQRTPRSCRRSSTRSLRGRGRRRSARPSSARLDRATERAKDGARATTPTGCARSLADAVRRLAAGRASATTSSSGCAPSTASTPTRSSRSASSSSRANHEAARARRPARSTRRRRADGRRPRQGRPPGDVRRRRSTATATRCAGRAST